MFGYLVAAPELMTEPQLGRYRAAYCGLCRSLRARHGQISGLTLTYDMRTRNAWMTGRMTAVSRRLRKRGL